MNAISNSVQHNGVVERTQKSAATTTVLDRPIRSLREALKNFFDVDSGSVWHLSATREQALKSLHAAA